MADTGTYVDDLPEAMRPPTAPPWEDVAESYKQKYPALDQEYLRVRYEQALQYRQARLRARDNPETTQQRLGRSIVPYASSIANAAENVQAARAQKRIEDGNPRPGDYDTAAAYEQLQKQQEERTRTIGGKLADAALTAPAMIGEFLSGGAALKAAGMAGALGGQALKVAIPTFGVRLAATTALAPSTYAKTFIDNNREAGRDPLALAGFPAAFGLGMVQNAILGSLGNNLGALGRLPGLGVVKALEGPGAANFVGRMAAKGGLGAVESQAADLVTGSVQDVVRAYLPSLTRKETHYGSVQDLLDGKGGEALKTVTAQALTFAMFGMMHEAMHGTPERQRGVQQSAVMETFARRLESEGKKGLSGTAAGGGLADVAERLAQHLESNPSPTRAEVATLLKDFKGTAGEYAQAVASAFPTKRSGPKSQPPAAEAPAPQAPAPPAAPPQNRPAQAGPVAAEPPAPPSPAATPVAPAEPVKPGLDYAELARGLGFKDKDLVEFGNGERRKRRLKDLSGKQMPMQEAARALLLEKLGGEEGLAKFAGMLQNAEVKSSKPQLVKQKAADYGASAEPPPPATEAKPVPEAVQPIRSTEEGPAPAKQEVVKPTLAEHAAILGKIVDRLNSDKELPSVIQKVYRKWGIDPGEVSVEIVGGRAKGKAVGPESDVDVVVRVEKPPRVKSTDDMDMRNAAMMEATKAVWDRYADLEGGKHIHVLEHFGSAKQEVVTPEPTAGRTGQRAGSPPPAAEKAPAADLAQEQIRQRVLKVVDASSEGSMTEILDLLNEGKEPGQEMRKAELRGHLDALLDAGLIHQEAGPTGGKIYVRTIKEEPVPGSVQLQQVFDRAGLTPLQQSELRDYHGGLTQDEIGRKRGVGRAAVSLNMRKSLARLEALGGDLPDTMHDLLVRLKEQNRPKAQDVPKEELTHNRKTAEAQSGVLASELNKREEQLDAITEKVSKQGGKWTDADRRAYERLSAAAAGEDPPAERGPAQGAEGPGAGPAEAPDHAETAAESYPVGGKEKAWRDYAGRNGLDPEELVGRVRQEQAHDREQAEGYNKILQQMRESMAKREKRRRQWTREKYEDATKATGLDEVATEYRNSHPELWEKDETPGDGLYRMLHEGNRKTDAPEQVYRRVVEDMQSGKGVDRITRHSQEAQEHDPFDISKEEAETIIALNEAMDRLPGEVARQDAESFDFGANAGKPLTAEERKNSVGGGQPNAGEAPPRELKRTDLSKEQVEIERRKDKREQLVQATRKEDEVVAAAVDAKLAENPNAGFELVRELQKKPRPLSDEDAALLVHHKTQLRNQYDRLADQMSGAYNAERLAKDTGGDVVAAAERVVEMQRRVADVDNALNEFDKVVAPSKTASARGLRWLGIVQAEDFSLHGMRQRLEMAKKGPLTKEESEKVAGLHERIKGLQDRIKELEARGGKAGSKEGEELKERRVDLVQARREGKRMENDARDASLSPTQKVLRGATGLADTSRGLITGFDLSYLFRQGAALTFAHPVKAFHAFVESIKAFGSERAADRAMNEINQRANSVLYRRAGVYLAEPEAGLSGQEEAFIGRWVGKIPGLAGSQRAYTTFLNRMRADVFDSMMSGLTRKGRGSDAEATAIANYVNVASGRGKLNTPFGSLEDSAVTLSRLFFSPRFVASRFQLLTGEPLWGGTRATRGAIALEYARFGLGLALFYGTYLLADDKARVSFEPRSSDFGKIVTDRVRIDPMAGLAQDVTLGARSGSGQTVSSTGKTTDLRGDKVPYRGDKIDDLVKDFVRRKFAPVPGAITNMVTGEDALHRPATLGKEALGLVTPLAGKDVLEALQEQGAPRGIATGILALLGMGTQVYEPRRPKKKNAG